MRCPSLLPGIRALPRLEHHAPCHIRGYKPILSSSRVGFGKSPARTERKFSKKGSTQPQGYFGQKPSQAAELSKKRTDEHKAKRGVKTKGLKEDKYISSFRDKLNNIK